MMQVDGCGITSANDTFFSSCRARVDLLVFFRVRSQLPSDHGNGPSGWASTDLMSNFLPVAISTIWPNNLWSAFRTVSLWVLLATLGLFMSEKVFNFCLGSESWKGFFLSSILSS